MTSNIYSSLKIGILLVSLFGERTRVYKFLGTRCGKLRPRHPFNFPRNFQFVHSRCIVNPIKIVVEL